MLCSVYSHLLKKRKILCRSFSSSKVRVNINNISCGLSPLFIDDCFSLFSIMGSDYAEGVVLYSSVFNKCRRYLSVNKFVDRQFEKHSDNVLPVPRFMSIRNVRSEKKSSEKIKAFMDPYGEIPPRNVELDWKSFWRRKNKNKKPIDVKKDTLDNSLKADADYLAEFKGYDTNTNTKIRYKRFNILTKHLVPSIGVHKKPPKRLVRKSLIFRRKRKRFFAAPILRNRSTSAFLLLTLTRSLLPSADMYSVYRRNLLLISFRRIQLHLAFDYTDRSFSDSVLSSDISFLNLYDY